MRASPKLAWLIASTLALAAGCATAPSQKDRRDQAVALLSPIDPPPAGQKTVGEGDIILEQVVSVPEAVRVDQLVDGGTPLARIEPGEVLYEVIRKNHPKVKTYCSTRVRRDLSQSTFHACLSDEDGDGAMDTLWTMYTRRSSNSIIGSDITPKSDLSPQVPAKIVEAVDRPKMTLQVIHDLTLVGDSQIKIRSAETGQAIGGLESLELKSSQMPKVVNLHGMRLRAISAVDGKLTLEILSGFPAEAQIAVYDAAPAAARGMTVPVVAPRRR